MEFTLSSSHRLLVPMEGHWSHNRDKEKVVSCGSYGMRPMLSILGAVELIPILAPCALVVQVSLLNL